MTRTTIVLFTLTFLLLPLPVGAADLQQRHSGILVAIEDARGLLRLEEMGPWTGELESTITRRELHLAPGLEVKLIKRDPDGTGEDGWRGGFADTPTTVSALRTGDDITVSTRRRGDDVVVELIEVVRPELGG
jgi:hypothetical protein